MVCDVIDFRCIFVNEIAGSVLLAGILIVMFYFMAASKMRLGFDTTIAFALPLILMTGLVITGFNVVFAFSTVLVAALLALVFNKFIGRA